ncbi:hypothetical protein H9Q69_002744 [Fusarium xylarioides]|uniref:Myb-like domain-containing protein n=1 Tax=Fusarium xylarioides TaxID=221167 RepID=A0A9P7I6H0_9HYPO|nr:hypothetical protein H9Q70_002378 [Fusarium xylarioides]KAG5771485.1 hypothetical protein H9Q72_001993 [Fusarium xylarioides]KAG5784293.1 hypothetical protein H9Q73_002068 [Fusarium xylarioides]KAG5798203.1 hypothetical protein H9Q69_002744 [Fusarium xylarioides]
MNNRSAAAGRSGRASAQNEKSEPRRSNRRNDPVQRTTSPAKNIVNQPVPVPEPVRVLLNDPVARRNPPPQAQDDISIPSIPLKPDDETEFYDEYDYSQPEDSGEELENVNSPIEELQLGSAITIAQQRILELSVPDLARAANSLFECFRGNEADDVFNGILAIKRRAFHTIRGEYDALDQSDTAPFIDFAHFVDDTPTRNQSVRVTQIARTNVVTAYDTLYGLKNEETSAVFPFLECLNRVLPAFFTPADNMFQNPQSTLHLRTWLFVEDLSHHKDEKDFRELLVAYFCKDEEEILKDLNRSGHKSEGGFPSYPELFSGGYFKDLGGEEGIDHDVDDLCSARIAQIKKIIDDNKEDGGISQLRRHFPLHNLVEDLLGCFESLYNVLEYEESVGAGTEPSQHGQQDAAYSQGNDYGSESQSIVRVGSQEAEPSLFVGPKSIQALRGGSRATSTVPPSNQQLADFRPGVPRDYHQDSNADLLGGSPFPPASSYRLATQGGRERERGQKRPRLSQDDEDGEDSFETDTRHVDPARREELQRQMPPPPRPQPVPRRPQRHASESSFSSGPVHPLSIEQSSQDMGLRSVPQAPMSSRPFNAIAKAASQRKKEVRMADPERQGPRQRVPWSEHDSQVLLDLIQEYGVRWSSIETMSERFEYPRNQQAYRDRARNLKTDILMIDMLLPPNFDGVALSNKEIAKIKGVGKNPFRKEADVDDHNNPINTELAESTPF